MLTRLLTNGINTRNNIAFTAKKPPYKFERQMKQVMDMEERDYFVEQASEKKNKSAFLAGFFTGYNFKSLCDKLQNKKFFACANEAITINDKADPKSILVQFCDYDTLEISHKNLGSEEFLGVMKSLRDKNAARYPKFAREYGEAYIQLKNSLK